MTAFARGRLDPLFALLTVVNIGLVASYAVMAPGESDPPVAATTKSTPGPTTPGPTTPGPTSGSAVVTTTSLPTTATNTSTLPGLPEFGQSSEDVYSNGTAKLEIGTYGLLFDSHNRWGSADGWGGDPDGSGSDLVFTTAGLAGVEGSQIALLSEPAPKLFATCRDQTVWTTSLTWQGVMRGDFLCLRGASGRRGLLRIDEVPDLDDRRAYVTVTGIVWEPIVGR